jgi:hypothetical protein
VDNENGCVGGQVTSNRNQTQVTDILVVIISTSAELGLPRYVHKQK